MRIFILFITILFHATYLSQISKPKMVIAIVVDQMKYEYVYRFWDDFGEKGFKKLIDEGTFVEIHIITMCPPIPAQVMHPFLRELLQQYME